MKISVILCTYNRCQSLAKVLDSAAASTLPNSVDWEVLVVDNNSTDQTLEVVESFARRHPHRFRYYFEPRQGKSYALNTGVRQARGDILAFTDDDVTVEPTWLRNLTASLHSGKWVAAGGRTLPDRTFSPPRWLAIQERYACGALAIFDRGPCAGELTEAPSGNNMAYRKEAFEKYGDFRTDLGPRPGSRDPQKCEDSEFGSRLLTAGELMRYEPAAIVYHAVPASRLRKEYFLNWWFDKARSDIRAFGVQPGTKWSLAGIPLALFRRLGVWTLRWMVAAKPRVRFECKLNVWVIAGKITECYRDSRRAKT